MYLAHENDKIVKQRGEETPQPSTKMSKPRVVKYVYIKERKLPESTYKTDSANRKNP